MHPKKLGLWCAVSRWHIVGSIFFERTVTAEVYRGIFMQFISLLWPDEHDCIFQQDRVTAHTAQETIAFLKDFFGDRLISHSLWPPRSPDLSPPDFFFMGMFEGASVCYMSGWSERAATADWGGNWKHYWKPDPPCLQKLGNASSAVSECCRRALSKLTIICTAFCYVFFVCNTLFGSWVAFFVGHPVLYDILMHNCIQRNFTSAMCPGTHALFFCIFRRI